MTGLHDNKVRSVSIHRARPVNDVRHLADRSVLLHEQYFSKTLGPHQPLCLLLLAH